MFSFNGVTIKGDEDFKEALEIQSDRDNFAEQCEWMAKRWGYESVFKSFHGALYGGDSFIGLAPAKFKTEFYDYSDVGDEGHLVPVDKIHEHIESGRMKGHCQICGIETGSELAEKK